MARTQTEWSNRRSAFSPDDDDNDFDDDYDDDDFDG